MGKWVDVGNVDKNFVIILWKNGMVNNTRSNNYAVIHTTILIDKSPLHRRTNQGKYIILSSQLKLDYKIVSPESKW